MQGLWNLIGKVGQGSSQAFPYEIGEKVSGLEGKSIWTLHKGKKKGSTEEVSIFAFDVKNSPPDQHDVAKTEYKRLKTLRHPNVLRFVDGFESEIFIYMVTEYAVPLELHLQDNRNDLEIAWGIHQIASALDFLINNGSFIHGNICISSVFVDRGGEWKLAGVAYIQPAAPAKEGGEAPTLSRFPWMQKYEPPEGRYGTKPRQKVEKWSPDMWGLGCLIWEIFNGSLQKSSSLKSVGKIPGNLLSHYGELVSANPKSRPNPAKFISQCRSRGQYLCNSFVDANLFLAQLQMKSQTEQKEFFKSLSSSLDAFPQRYCKDKILPQLLNAFEYGPAGSSVLAPLFKISKLLEAEEYQQKIVPCVVKLFSSTDRATRIQLLQQLDNFVQYLQPAVVNDQIFPNVAMGFGDTVPAMREHTIKSMLLLAPKLTEKTINNQLLKYFAKLQMDEQPSIRTNTTVCLGKIAEHLPEATRQKVIVSAFLRALRDPFPPARMAGINALCSTLEFTPVRETAIRVLPVLCTMTVDPEKPVRDQGFKAIRLMLAKVEKFSEESAVKEGPPGQTNPSPASSDGNSQVTWTGWAVSSLTSKFYKGAAPGAPPGKEGGPVAALGSKNKDPASSASNVAESTKPSAKSATTGERLDDVDNSDSDYEEEWGDDGWGKDRNSMAGLRNELVAARNELVALEQKGAASKKGPGTLIGDGDDDDDSDFGDWDQDNWTSTNDSGDGKQSRDKAKSRTTGEKIQGKGLKLGGTKKTPVNEDALLSELLGASARPKPGPVPETSWGDDWNDMKDSFVQDEKWTQDFLQKESNTTLQKDGKSRPISEASGKTRDRVSKKPKETGARTRVAQDAFFDNTSGDGWGSEDWAPLDDAASTTASCGIAQPPAASGPDNSRGVEGGWETEGWDNFGNFEDKNENSASKADMARKKREEKRRLREQAMKEKRAGKGSMKLGAVKKAD